MTIGSFSHTAHKTINNPVNLDVDKDSTWTVTGDSYLNTLDLAAEDCITAADPETVYTTALTVGDVAYEYGTYTINNVTIKVEASDIVIPDTGIAAEGQTFVNIPYVFYVENEDGTYNSAAAKVATLNTPSGTVLFSVDVQDGYEIVSTTPTNGQIDPSTDFAEYPYVLSFTGGPMDQMRVVIKVRAKGATPALDGLAMAEDGNWYLSVKRGGRMAYKTKNSVKGERKRGLQAVKEMEAAPGYDPQATLALAQANLDAFGKLDDLDDASFIACMNDMRANHPDIYPVFWWWRKAEEQAGRRQEEDGEGTESRYKFFMVTQFLLDLSMSNGKMTGKL